MNRAKYPKPERKKRNEWIAIIDKMIYSFTCIASKTDYPHEEEMFKEIKAILKANNVKRKDYHFNEISDKLIQPIYEKYRPIFLEEERKLQEGLDLFAKHFRNIST